MVHDAEHQAARRGGTGAGRAVDQRQQAGDADEQKRGEGDGRQGECRDGAEDGGGQVGPPAGEQADAVENEEAPIAGWWAKKAIIGLGDKPPGWEKAGD
jgi:hypothetical protein